MVNLPALFAEVHANRDKTYTYAQLAAKVEMGDPNEAYSSVFPLPAVGTTGFLGREIEYLTRFYRNALLTVFKSRDDKQFLENGMERILLGAAAAKVDIGGVIGPVNQGTLVPSLIRPETVYASTGAATYNWLTSVAAAGWSATYWNIDLSTTTGSTTVLSPNQRVVMSILGQADFDPSPKLQGVQWYDTAGNKLGVQELSMLQTPASIAWSQLTQSLYVGLRKKVTADLKFVAPGTSSPQPFGVQYQTVDYATAETS